MLTTIESVRIKQGDRVTVTIGDKAYEAEVTDAGDPSKLKVRLDNNVELWIGRRAVEFVGDEV